MVLLGGGNARERGTGEMCQASSYQGRRKREDPGVRNGKARRRRRHGEGWKERRGIEIFRVAEASLDSTSEFNKFVSECFKRKDEPDIKTGGRRRGTMGTNLILYMPCSEQLYPGQFQLVYDLTQRNTICLQKE